MLIKSMKQSADLISFFSSLLLFYTEDIWFQIMKKIYTACIYHKIFIEVLTLPLPHIYEPSSITYFTDAVKQEIVYVATNKNRYKRDSWFFFHFAHLISFSKLTQFNQPTDPPTSTTLCSSVT